MALNLRDQIDLREIGSHSYVASAHPDWAIGSSLHGGCVAAIVHQAARIHAATTLKKFENEDILSIQLGFLRPCTLSKFNISIIDLKCGSRTCAIQLQLAQEGKLNAVAQVILTNFDKAFGPSAKTDWSLRPLPSPRPDFENVSAQKSDENWISGTIIGELCPLTKHILTLYPRQGFPEAGIHDSWNTLIGKERIDAMYLALMNDMVPSMSDTLLHNGGIYDAHKMWKHMKQWDDLNPGVPATLTNSINEAAEMPLFNSTVTLDIQFIKKLPEDGLKWIFTRASSRRLLNGRMDLDVTICDSNMEPLCISRQLILALDSRKRFAARPQSSL